MTREKRAREVAQTLLTGKPVGMGDGQTRFAPTLSHELLTRVLLDFADEEAAAMRERAAECAESMAMGCRINNKSNSRSRLGHRICDAIRALPATGEE